MIVQTNYNSKVWLILLEFFKSKLNIFVEIVTEILLRKWTKVTFSLVVLGHEYINSVFSIARWLNLLCDIINSRFSKVEGGLSLPPRVWRRGAPPPSDPPLLQHWIQLYSVVHTLALTQRAQTQDKCNACIRSSHSMFYSKSWVRINGWFQLQTKFWSRQEERNPLP
jgi:hypothetical protein